MASHSFSAFIINSLIIVLLLVVANSVVLQLTGPATSGSVIEGASSAWKKKSEKQKSKINKDMVLKVQKKVHQVSHNTTLVSSKIRNAYAGKDDG